MEYNEILNNIDAFFEKASPEDFAEINAILSSETEDDLTLEEYLEGMSSQYFYIEDAEECNHYTSDITSLKVYASQFDNVGYISDASYCGISVSGEAEDSSMSISKLVKQAA